VAVTIINHLKFSSSIFFGLSCLAARASYSFDEQSSRHLTCLVKVKRLSGCVGGLGSERG
jgi:hypothetical protein